ncbi:MAG: acetyl-CoA C-acyltransferase [Gammaproteobacteria bacterium]
MGDVFLFDAVRTPRTKGKPDGALATVPPHELVRQLADWLRARHGAEAIDATERLALGCVTQFGPQGGHIALLSRVHAGLPDTAVALTLNNYCVSGLSAVAGAARAIAAGDESLALAGGVECMSQAGFEADRAPFYRDAALAAGFKYVPPPITADWLATQEGITREELDAVTVESHRRAGRAWEAGRYRSSVAPVQRPDGSRVEHDDLVRPALTTGDLARFGPAFAELGALGPDAFIARSAPGLGPIQHLHTIAHCPPIADGAALALIGTAAKGAELGLKPRARIAALLELNADPLQPFEAGFIAFERILERAGLAPADADAIEFMEAFAAVPARFRRRYGAVAERANESGGHLAMGHPMGASGAILLTTLLAELERRDGEWGVAVAHAVSGVACAVLLRRG